ncbi:glutathione S-transferase family protein [Pararhodobacter sp.]|uniref:glutathione S-transferase family protein n=1 Tax=Pararhodobacter sp. TaxID=2127056 RepID=UPI002FE12043
MILYSHPFSGNGWKVRLFLSLIGQDCEIRTVDLPGGENRSTAFLDLNPRGQVPVLAVPEGVLWDSQAILVYLAARHAPDWGGDDAFERAAVAQWLSFAAKEVATGLQALRLHRVMGRPLDVPAATRVAEGTLTLLEGRLAAHGWLVGGRPTIAEAAVYPYVSMAGEAGLSLAPYPSIRGWCARIEALPGFLPMGA